MLPYQKYPSIYKGPQQQDQYISGTPQSPFDMAYGSSLLPRQLLVSSPYIQVPAPPLNSPYGMPNTSSYGTGYSQGYFVGPPVPKLAMPPRRQRRLDKHQEQQHTIPETPSKVNTKSSSIPLATDSTSTTSSFADEHSEGDDCKDNHERVDSTSVSSNPLYNSANSSKSANLNLIYKGTSLNLNNYPNNNIQISKKPTRSIVLTNVGSELTLTKFLDYVSFGPIENIRLLPNSCPSGLSSIILAFVHGEACLEFYKSISIFSHKFKKVLKSPTLRISFIKTKKLISHIAQAIENDGATRNVYVGNVDSLEREIDEDFILKEFQKFGTIEKIDFVEKLRTAKKSSPEENEKDIKYDTVPEKCAFIHFTNIASAIKTVEQLNLNAMWSNSKIFYGTDRCSVQNNNSLSVVDEDIKEDVDTSDNEFQNVVTNGKGELILLDEDEYEEETFDHLEDTFDGTTDHYTYDAPVYHNYGGMYGPPHGFQNYYGVGENFIHQNQALHVVQNLGGIENSDNRTICLSNLDPATTVEDVCNVVRGGILQQIKYFPQKRVCFVTFIEPSSAAQFFAHYQLNQLTLHGRRIRIGWGANPGPLPTKIALAVTVGASRNVYIGIKRDEDEENGDRDDHDDHDDTELPSEEELRKDFKDFGEIEQINYFKNNSCVFLNFFNIANAIRLISDANGNQSENFHNFFNGKYSKFKISYGKDRCGNPPKTKSKKKKRKNKNRLRKDENHEADEENGEETDDVPLELLSSMGITKEEDKPEEIEVNELPIDAFGISSTPRRKQSLQSCFTEDDDESLKIITTADESRRHAGDEDYKPYSHPKQGTYSRNSLNNGYSSHQLQYQFQQYPQGSRQYGNRPKRYYNSTNGSQVMAQYLQQSQHANLFYAANILSVVDGADGDYGYYDTGYHQEGKRANRQR